MPTIQELQQQVEQTRKELESQRQNVQNIKIPQLSVKELLKQTPQSMQKYKEKQKSLEEQKQSTLKQLGQYEQQVLIPAEQQYKQQQIEYQAALKEQAEWKQAEQWVIKGKPIGALYANPSLMAKAEQIAYGGSRPSDEELIISQTRGQTPEQQKEIVRRLTTEFGGLYKSGEITGYNPTTGTMTIQQMPSTTLPSVTEQVKQPNIPDILKTTNVLTKEGFETYAKNVPQPVYNQGKVVGYNTGTQSIAIQEQKPLISTQGVNLPEVYKRTSEVVSEGIKNILNRKQNLVLGVKNPITYGQVLGASAKGVEMGLGYISDSATTIIKKTGVKTETTIPASELNLYQRSTIMDSSGASGKINIPETTQKTFFGNIPSVIKIADLPLYFIPVVGEVYAGSQVAKETSYNLPNVKKEAEKLALKDYEEYKNTPLTQDEINQGYRKSTKEEYLSQIQPQYETQLTQQSYSSIFGNVAFLGMSGTSRITGKVTQNKFYKTGEIKPQVNIESIEVRQPYIENGKMIYPSEFNMIISKSAGEVKGYGSTPIREFLNIKPKETFDWTVVSNPQRYVARPAINDILTGAIATEPYIMKVSKVLKSEISNTIPKGLGKTKLTDISIPEKPVQIEPNQLTKLPRRQQYIIEELVAKEITGVPTKVGNIPNLLKQEDIISIVNVKSEELFKKAGKKYPAQRTSLFETVSISRPIKELETGETVYEVLTGFKDVTKPFARATGKISTMKNIVITKNPIDLTPVESFGITPANIERTSLDKTFQIVKQIKKEISKVPVSKYVPKTRMVIPKAEPTSKVLPSMVGGLGLETTNLPYSGTNTYETTFGAVPNQRQQNDLTNLGNINIQQPKNTQFEDLRLETSQTNILKIKPEEINILKSPQRELFRQPQREIFKQPQEEVQIEKQLSKQISKQIEKQIQKQTQRQIQKEIQITRPKPPTPTKIKVPTPFGSTKEELKKIAKGIKGNEFEVFTRKGGKDIFFKKATSAKEAGEILSKELSTTLRASGFVTTKTGEKISPSELGILGSEFGISKVNNFRIIQRKERRLSKTPEVKEIHYFKKTKSKKLKFI